MGRCVVLLFLLLTLSCSSAHISGEVFTTVENGHVFPAAGADVLAIRSTGEKWLDFTRSLEEKRVQRKWHDAPAGIDIDFKSEGGYCSFLWHGGGLYYFGSHETATRTDRDGRFELKASQGKLIVFVAGQAGSRCAVWADEVSLGWRGQTIRLSSPLCTYQAEADPAHSC